VLVVELLLQAGLDATDLLDVNGRTATATFVDLLLLNDEPLIDPAPLATVSLVIYEV
jgi:hypothetical protein